MANHVNGLDEIDMEYTLDAWGDVPPLHARELYAQYDATRAEFVAPDTCHKLHARIAELERERDAAQQSRARLVKLVRRYCDLNRMNLEFFLDSEKLLKDSRIKLDAANQRAEQAEAELVEAQSRLIAGEVCEKLDSVKYWKTRAEQAEADARALASLHDRYHLIDLTGNEEGAGMWSAFIAKYLDGAKKLPRAGT